MRWGLGAGVMLVAALQASAAIVPPPAATGTASGVTSPRLTVFGIPQAVTGTQATKLDGSLAQITQRYATVSPDHPMRDLHQMNPAVHFLLATPLATPLVSIDAVTTGDSRALKAALEGLGLQGAAVFSNDVGGWLPVTQIAKASALAQLHFMRAAMPRKRSSIVATQGDFAQRSSTVRSTYPSLTGTGVTVGILSDSFNCLATYEQSGSGVPASGYKGYAPFGFTATYTTDQQPSTGQAASTSALPAGVNVLAEGPCMEYGAPYQPPFGDEGRAILQIIHAIAPGAGLAFYTAVNSEADFANGIGKLAAAGAKVIDDDVGYPDEPFFQDGILAQAINTASGQGVVYFSSAGNDGTTSYENTTPSFAVAGSGVQAGEKLLNFDPSAATTSTALSMSIPALYPGEFIYLILGWDQPYVTGSPNSGGATSSIDMCLSGAGADLLTDDNSYPNPVTCSGGSPLGKDPVQLLILGNPASATGNTPATTVTLSIGLVANTTVPGRIKFLLSGNGADAAIHSTFAPGGPTIQGHPMAATAAAVGAAFYFDTPQCGTSVTVLEDFSSEGGDPILFDTTGARLSSPQMRHKPDFVAPDGINNTMLGATLTQSNDQISTTIAGCEDNASFPNFYGTSAAAPHAAAAAALMLQANPALTNTQIIAALQNGALPMSARATSATGYDYDDGHGFVDVNAAFAQLPAAAPGVSVSPSSVAVGSSATLTWAAINASGCTASGSWSGAQSNSGTQTVTPGAAGTNTYTLTCTGTNGAVSSMATLTVTSVSSGSGSGGHGGGAIGTGTLLSLGAVLLLGRRLRRQPPLIASAWRFTA
jgi:subtilisin family serine protease